MSAASLLFRGANDMMLDEIDRSVHDALCAVKRVLESGSVVPGRLFIIKILPILFIQST